MRTIYPWHRVNWSLSDTEIARRLGCSSSAVYFARRRFGMPLPEQTYSRRSVEVEIPRRPTHQHRECAACGYDANGNEQRCPKCGSWAICEFETVGAA